MSDKLRSMKYRFDNCILDAARRTLTRADHRVAVEPQVFDIILLLARNAERMVTRDELIKVVWGGRIVSESAISARIAAARKAVGDDGKRQAVIRTVARRGLQMATEVSREAAKSQNDSADAMPPIQYTRNRDGRMIAYTLSGEGPPLLHVGFFARSIELEWHIDFHRHKNQRLAEHFRFLSYDEVGAGLSDRDVNAFSLTAYAEDIGAVADAAGYQRFSIFAESAGAMRAVVFAANYPERVQSMVFSGGYVDGRMRRGTHGETDFVRALISEGWDPSRQALGRTYMTLYAPDGPQEAANAAAEMMQASTSREIMLGHRDIINNATIAPYLEKVECPVLAIHARRDSVHPLSEAKKMVSSIRNAELHVLDSGNHIPVGLTPLYEEYLDTVINFLKKTTTGFGA